MRLYFILTILITTASVVFFCVDSFALWPFLAFFTICFAVFSGVISMGNGKSAALHGICVTLLFPLSMIFACSLGFRDSMITVSGEDVTPDKLDALYFSIVTWTTLGYGDMSPTPTSRLPALTLAVSGYIFSGYLIGFFFKVVPKIEAVINK